MSRDEKHTTFTFPPSINTFHTEPYTRSLSADMSTTTHDNKEIQHNDLIEIFYFQQWYMGVINFKSQDNHHDDDFIFIHLNNGTLLRLSEKLLNHLIKQKRIGLIRKKDHYE